MVPFADLAAAQAAVDAWVEQYNTTRQHQALGMAVPVGRFTSGNGTDTEDMLPLRLPLPRQVRRADRPQPRSTGEIAVFSGVST